MNLNAIEEQIERRISELGTPVKPRLRFDKVALRFLSTVKESLSEAVPDGKTVVLTITAPIRVASKTATELDIKIRARLARDSLKTDLCDRVQGNHVRVRILSSPKGAPKVLGFVHNPAPGAAEVLLNTTQSLLK